GGTGLVSRRIAGINLDQSGEKLRGFALLAEGQRRRCHYGQQRECENPHGKSYSRSHFQTSGARARSCVAPLGLVLSFSAYPPLRGGLNSPSRLRAKKLRIRCIFSPQALFQPGCKAMLFLGGKLSFQNHFNEKTPGELPESRRAR